MRTPTAIATHAGATQLLVLSLLALVSFVSALPLATAASTTSTIAVTSQNSSGATLTGFRTLLYSSSDEIISESFTPSAFTVTVGDTYGVRAESYGSCNFSQWSDGVTGDPRTYTATSSGVTFAAVYDCGGVTTTSSVAVNSVDQAGAAITGFRTVLYSSSGSVVDEGFTPSTFNTTSGQTYGVRAESYGNCTFSTWSDGVTSDPRSFTATSSAVTFTAEYACASTAPSSSTVTIDSVNQFGNAIAGYYTTLYNSGESVISSGFTPKTFDTTSGDSYSVSADGYGTCTFTKWSDGVTTDPLPFTATGSAVTFTAVYECAGASQYSSISVTSVNEIGTSTGGYTVTLLNSAGATVATGTTPVTFNTTIGQSYKLEAQSSNGGCAFSFWDANGTTNLPLAFTATSTAQSTSAVYDCNNGGSTTITIYAHRIPAGYWAACFATTCAAGTGPGATMYYALRNTDGTLIATGFANENGLTFTGLTPGATYYLEAEDCDSCHSSTHDVLFDHWGDGNTTDPIAIVAGSSLDAWYTCTNGCGGD